MSDYYRDPTAWTAIANVDREQRQKQRKRKHKRKKKIVPREKVDWKKVLKSENKVMTVNRQQLFISAFGRNLNGLRKQQMEKEITAHPADG